MTDYTELVEALWHCYEDDDACATCQRWLADDEWGIKCKGRLISDAAAAIEELQAEVESMDESCKKQLVAMASHVAELQAEVKRLKDSNEELRERQTFIDHYGTEWMTSAKDVPTAAYEHGYMDGRDEAMVKMEVQDESAGSL